MYNKRDTVGSLILVVITFITVGLMINMAQRDSTMASDGGYRDRAQVQNAGGHQDTSSARQQSHTGSTWPDGNDQASSEGDALKGSSQRAAEAQKDGDWREKLDRLNGRLQKWFEKPGQENGTPSQTQPQPQRDKDKNRKVVEPDKVENARNSVSFKDKMEILRIIAKVSPGDIYKVSQLINGGVTMAEGKEIDRILNQHLSNQEMKALNKIIKKYITW